jgi:single-strand DNA-binding protein
MQKMNKFIVTGNLTSDANLQYSTNEKAYSKFTIANNEGFGDNKKATFFNCTLWGKSAENLNRYLVKGQKVLITGKIDINKYTDKEGVNRQNIEINVDSFGGVEFMGGKSNSSESSNEQSNYSMPINNALSSNTFEEDITPVDDGDMPFN